MQKISKNLLFLLLVFTTISRLSAQSTTDKEIREIVNQLINKMGNTSIKNVAVIDLTVLDGTPTELGKYLAEELTFSLTNAERNFEVIERGYMNQLLKEAKLDAQGLLDPASKPKLDKLKGMEAVIVGTTTEQGDIVKVNVKLVKLETASIIANVRGDISKTPTIIALLQRITPKPPPPPKPKKAESPQYKAESPHFLLTLDTCVRENTSIICYLTIKSKQKNVDFGILPENFAHHSSLFDNDGNKIRASSVQIANSGHTATLITDVATKAIITFNNVPKTANSISLLYLAIWTYDRVDFPNNGVEFKNISFE